MKKNSCLCVLAVTLAAAFTLQSSSAQLLYDGFDYNTGNTLGGNGWNLIASSGGVATNVVSQNLAYSGLQASVGNAVELRPNGQDWFDTFATQTYTTSTTTSLYYSFLIRVDSLGALDASGGNFVALSGPSGTSGQSAAVWLRTSGSGYQVGLSKRLSSPVFDSTVHETGDILLIVASYNLNAGPINNDTASLWVNPSSLSTPPSPLLTTPVSGVNDDVIEFGSVVLWPQGAAGSTRIPGSLIFDEVRVGNSWTSVTPIPEPSTVGLVAGFALACLSYKKLRQRRAQ